jgi:hypothetical protein
MRWLYNRTTRLARFDFNASDVAGSQGSRALLLQVRYELKTPYRDGTTHVIFEPMDFIARLVALVPKPRANLTRFHGVFAPNSAHRAQVTPSKRGKGNKACTVGAPEDTTPAERRTAMTWAQRLKRVFTLDIETCNSCGGIVKIIACIEDPVVIDKILTHLDNKAAGGGAQRLPPCRAPPQASLFACSRERCNHEGKTSGCDTDARQARDRRERGNCRRIGLD